MKNTATRKRKEMKTTLKGTTTSRSRSSLEHKETSVEEVVGEEDAAVMVHVSASEGVANPNPTRNHKGRLNKEALSVKMHKLLLHQRRLTWAVNHPMSNNNSNTYLSPDTRCYICNEMGHIGAFCPLPDRGSQCGVVANQCAQSWQAPMAVVILGMWYRGVATSPITAPIEGPVKDQLLLDEPEDQVRLGTLACR